MIHARLANAHAAEKDHRQAIQLDSNDPTVYFHRGRALWTLKQYDGALEQFDQAIRLAPGYSNAYCWRARVHQIIGAEDEARADRERGLREDPANARCGLPLAPNRGRR